MNDTLKQKDNYSFQGTRIEHVLISDTHSSLKRKERYRNPSMLDISFPCIRFVPKYRPLSTTSFQSLNSKKSPATNSSVDSKIDNSRLSNTFMRRSSLKVHAMFGAWNCKRKALRSSRGGDRRGGVGHSRVGFGVELSL
jgi:hypothetical protein